MKKTENKRFGTLDSYVSMVLGLAVVFVIGSFIFNLTGKKSNTPINQNKTGVAVDQLKNTEPTNPNQYTVKTGDTLWSIAENQYHDGYKWTNIAKVNNIANPNIIESGTVLTLPPIQTIQTKQTGQITAATSVGNLKKYYTVKHGDILWNIAMTNYGDPYKWTEIAQVNKLANPNIIHSGNVLYLP
jgi:nucleoid-associated protein YgaU